MLKAKFTKEIFDLKLRRAHLASQSGIANFVNNTYFDYEVKNVISKKNTWNELSKNVKAISTRHKKIQLLAQKIFRMQVCKGIFWTNMI